MAARPGRRSCTCCCWRAPARCWSGTARASSRPDDDRLGPAKRDLAQRTNPAGERGELPDALDGADVFIGVSAGNVLAVEDLARMNERAVVFPMANPTPEVDPVRARQYASIVASGRSDLPNQINNVLAFPGVFRGLLDARATEISDGMLLAAADALAAVVRDDQLNANFIIPSVFDPARHGGGRRRRRRPGPAGAGRDRPRARRGPRHGLTCGLLRAEAQGETRRTFRRGKSPDGGRRGRRRAGMIVGCPSCPRWRRWPRSSARTPSAT